MANASPAAPPGTNPPLPQLFSELQALVTTYVKQQTLVPLQQLGRYIAFGIVGALLLGIGVLFLSVAGLRALQTETGDTFQGDWSWAPYLIVTVTTLVGGALTWAARLRARTTKGRA